MKGYLSIILLIITAFEAEVWGECPSIDDISLKPDNESPTSPYTCAQFWEGKSDSGYFVDACLGM